MVIDIITYTEAQFAALSKEKLEEVRAAQLKKDKLKKELDKKIFKEKVRLINNGVMPSTIFEKRCAELTANYEAEVAIVREALLFYLQYVNAPKGEGGTAPPYPVDYALSEEDRMAGVSTYYMTAYENPAERFAAFKADAFVRVYLGELYAPLWHYFEALV